MAIELGSSDISIERPFTIAVVIQNSETRPVIDFPAIKGFTKKGTSTSVTPIEIGGKSVVSQVITQTYTAQRPGQYRLLPFNLTVGETVVHSEGTIITVRPGAGPLPDIPPAEAPAGAINKNDAFLSLSTSKSRVFAGEGFSVKLSFFVAESYPFELTFYELEPQLQLLLKTLRPVNCWEENTGISELKPVPVLIRNRRYTEYRIYQATFFPLNRQPIRLPSVSLKLVQFRPSATPGGPRRRDFVGFTTRPLSVEVVPLPLHPLQDQVAVGQYRLIENLSRRAAAIGQSVRYTFRIVGEGNIASLPAPIVPDSSAFDIFPPEQKEVVNRMGEIVSGHKNFQYTLVPQQDGSFPLGSFFRWVYFDPVRERYDTLRSGYTLRVGGAASAPGDTIRVSLPGSIYTGIEQISSSEQPINLQQMMRLAVNIVLIVMILGMMYLFWKK
ncbi:BatD family protein [Larkinella soli]|uniref:BatD family protein n=1 Tax=Larkinella soli TaxID=1770527 RepID=UPI0013E340DB|nr:BatD family protein [Larkinella soli]